MSGKFDAISQPDVNFAKIRVNLADKTEQNLNTTNEQDSNLNGDFQNSNLTNFSSKKFVRDYDKEPLIIKSYEGFFVKTSVLCPMFFCITILIIFDKYQANTIFVTLWLCFVFCWIFIPYYYYVVRHKFEVKFTNNFIEFYKDGKLKRKSARNDLDEIIVKPFWKLGPTKSDLGDKIFYFIIFMALLYAIGWTLAWLLALYKIFSQLLLVGSLKRFTLFPSIIVDYPIYPKYFLYNGIILAGEYFMFQIFSDDEYQEIKTYFLDRKNIDIDKVKKYYFI